MPPVQNLEICNNAHVEGLQVGGLCQVVLMNNVFNDGAVLGIIQG